MPIPEHKKVTAVGRLWRKFTRKQAGDYESPLEAALAGVAACGCFVAILLLLAIFAEIQS